MKTCKLLALVYLNFFIFLKNKTQNLFCVNYVEKTTRTQLYTVLRATGAWISSGCVMNIHELLNEQAGYEHSSVSQSKVSSCSPQALEKVSGGPTCVPAVLYPLVDTPK